MPRVLVVDDEKDLRSLLEYNLLQSGFTVVTAEDGTSALERGARVHHQTWCSSTCCCLTCRAPRS